MEWRVISSCALAVNASASASKVVASAFASKARMSCSALASMPSVERGVGKTPRLVAPHFDGTVSTMGRRGSWRTWASTCTAAVSASSGCSRSVRPHEQVATTTDDGGARGIEDAEILHLPPPRMRCTSR
jgi:hypothetical protein